MNPRFNNKICIVTGAAQGIGQGVALALAAEGGTVVLADRSEFVHHTAEAIRSAGGKCLTVMADLETFAGAQSVVDAAVAEFGRVDVAVHNVGGTIWAKPYQEYAEAEIEAEVAAAVAATGAAGMADMGKVMGVLKTRLAGKADMGEVNKHLKAALSA